VMLRGWPAVVAPGRRRRSCTAHLPGLLDHLATLSRETIRIAGQDVDKLTARAPHQRRAFDL
jgi:hypothetical protein